MLYFLRKRAYFKGAWNFLLNEIIQLEISQECSFRIFSVNIMGCNLYPLNTVLEKKDYSYNSDSHWSKVKMIITSI
jgi:hypothetical protein